MTCAFCDWRPVARLRAGGFRTALRLGGFRWGTRRAGEGGGRTMVVRHEGEYLVQERLCPGSEAKLVRAVRRGTVGAGVAPTAARCPCKEKETT